MTKILLSFLLLGGAAWPQTATGHADSVAALPDSSPRSTTWAQEPSSFFGIKLGQPLSTSVPECEKDTLNGSLQYRVITDNKPCFENNYGSLKVRNIDAFVKVFVIEVQGRVEAITTSRDASYNVETYSALLERFGTPAKVSVATVHTRAGVAYTNHTSTWQGKDVRIVFDSVGSRVDKCDIQVTTRAYDAYQAAQLRDGAKSVADSF